ncbi:MAG: hypothetical protein HGA87_08030 [Desulfobulbaceae bacterium]|jgi:hypothetical protein|nr:hypothetical protein [Desulfobulbaceae bacterium]
MLPNKYTALERLQHFKSVASFGVLRAALIEESGFAGEPCPNPTDEMVFEFAEMVGFAQCDSDGCGLWYNKRKAWFVEDESKNICRMCAQMKGLDPDF